MSINEPLGVIRINTSFYNNSYYAKGHPISNIKITTSIEQVSHSWFEYSVNLVIDGNTVDTFSTLMSGASIYSSADADGNSFTVADRINPGTMIDYIVK